jgi:hypothetical protein
VIPHPCPSATAPAFAPEKFGKLAAEDQFLGSNAYAGATQLAAVRTVQSRARSEIDDIIALLSTGPERPKYPEKSLPDNNS